MSTWQQSTAFRVSLALGYLVSVNLLSGLIAITFRYPSLFGGTDAVFLEYAAPLPFTWALAHLLTMIPASLLVMGMPVWDERMMVRARWIAVAILVVCVGIEISERFNRFQKIPFVLFVMVDAGLFLLLALILRPDWRLISGIAGATLLAAGVVYLPPLVREMSRGTDNVADVALHGLISDVELLVDHHYRKVDYVMQISAIPHPDDGEIFDAVCDEAKEKYQAALVSDPPPEDLPRPGVLFMVRGWFEDEPTLYHPAGYARISDTGLFLCQPAYPEPPRE